MADQHDIRVLRDLVQRYADVAALPVQDERRALWREHHSLRPTRPLIMATFGMWNVWCREVFGNQQMQCQDPFYREHERGLRMHLFAHDIGDDVIQEPWLTQRAAVRYGWDDMWGLPIKRVPSSVEGGAWGFDAVLREWSDVDRLVAPRHVVDEAATDRAVAKLHEAVGDLLPINVDRSPICKGFGADISTMLARLRGFEQIMYDMYEAPNELHRLLAFMRDGTLANQAEAVTAGDWSRTSGECQGMTYCHELPPPAANVFGQSLDSLYAFSASQEFTLISPAQHEEFMLQYQRPIMEQFGLSAYGCCENLTEKIDLLRSVRNLRQIAVAPTAEVAKCAERIGADYVFSWRPNPTDMVCCGWDEDRIRRIIGDGLRAARGCRVHLHLKDIETVEGDPTRLARWVGIVREVADEVWAN